MTPPSAGSFIDHPGIWARSPRVVAGVGRKRVARAVKAGKREMPTTTFTRRDQTTVTVPRVVNNDVPRLLYLSIDEAHYEPVATPSWERCMDEAAATMADRLAAELIDRLERMASKGSRR
ncbi:hypothetical protein [Methylobacterium sp. WL6]|uniref:hypothetical protein n=1 Tax=Methylobacterium sp. WL6 TaxID=2603901 RepID=UPI001FEE52BD|nr:hypothetical protein [Methylobacterium sp. WL6]